MTQQSKSSYSRRRKQRGMKSQLLSVNPLVAIAATAIVIFMIAALARGNDKVSAPDYNVPEANSLLEVAISEDLPEQIIHYTGFVVSFNRQTHMPNYVAWELTREEASATGKRESDFEADKSVEGCASLADYRRSGFDRGHMIPAADCKWSPEAMKASHYLTNICPQEHSLNGGPWAVLEDNCRNWAVRDSAIYIVCGPVPGDKVTRTIGVDNEIGVPERFFKVILAPYANPQRAIAAVMPNGKFAGGVQAAITSIDEVELITGYDFFAALPDSIENIVEQQTAYNIWQRQTP